MTMQERFEKLLEASKAYHNLEESGMTDETFDREMKLLEEQYKTSGENNPEIEKLLYTTVDGGTLVTEIKNKVERTIPMLSLDKANNEEDLEKYTQKMLNNGASGFTLQLKLDGFACAVEYVGGKINVLSTRGDGLVGENLNYLVNNEDLKITNLPIQINSKKKIEVRGEIFMTATQFETASDTRFNIEGERFSLSRSAVAGLVKKAEKGIGYKATATFAVYSVYENDKPIPLENLDILSSQFLSVVDLTKNYAVQIKEDVQLTSTNKADDLIKMVNDFLPVRTELTIPNDGIVIKPTNEVEMLEKMGANSKFPFAFMAYKYPGLTVKSTIRDIDYSIGIIGKITPRASIDTVEIDGSMVSFATLNNFAWMQERNIGIGAEVEVTKANDIIPMVVNVLVAGEAPAQPPTNCPTCDTQIVVKNEGRTVLCPNKKCAGRQLAQLIRMVKRGHFDIDGLSESALTNMFNAGLIKELADLFTLTKEKLENSVFGTSSRTGKEILVGEKRATNIFNAIQKAKTNTNDYIIMANLGFDTLGRSIFKKMIQEFGTIEDCFVATKDQLIKLEGWSDKRVEIFLGQVDDAKENYQSFINNGVKPILTRREKSTMSGKTFSITGKVPSAFNNRGEFVAEMENRGWTFASAPRKGVDVVIGDVTSGSSKAKKALALGIEIVDPEDFWASL